MQTSHNHSEKKREKAVCIIGGESEALGFHQETTEESRKHQDRFCIKTLYYIFTRLPSFFCSMFLQT